MRLFYATVYLPSFLEPFCMSLSEFFATIQVGEPISGQLHGQNTRTGKPETIDISGIVTEINHYKDMHVCEIGSTRYKIIWTPNPQPPIERIAQRTTADRDIIVCQIATTVEIQIWVYGDNRGPDEWRNIYTLYLWEDASFPDADKTGGFCPEEL